MLWLLNVFWAGILSEVLVLQFEIPEGDTVRYSLFVEVASREPSDM